MLRVALVATALLRAAVFGAGVLGTGMLGLVGCTRELDDDRPPLPAPCQEAECAAPIGGIPVGGGVAQGGSGGAGGTGGAEPATLEGRVRLVTSADLVDTQALAQPVDVFARGFTIAQVRTTTEVDGSFRLKEVAQDSALLVHTLPSERDTSLDAVETLQTVDSDTTTTTNVSLSLLSGAMLSDLIDASFIVNPTVFDTTRGTAIVSIVNDRGDPLDGVILPPSNGQTSIAYDDGGLYSDALDQTGGRGSFVLLNVPVQSTGTLLRFFYNGAPYESRVSLAQGAVTLHTARISPP